MKIMKRRPLKSRFAAVLPVALAALVLGAASPAAFAEYEGAEQTEREAFVDVVVPLSLDFTVDPVEIAGRGQIYSDTGVIENRGAGDVLFMIDEARVEYANDRDFVPMTEPFDAGIDDPEKKIYMELTLGARKATLTGDFDMPPMLLAGAGGENSLCPIGVSGSVNAYSEKKWRDGDVKITLRYRISAAPQTEPNAVEDGLTAETSADSELRDEAPPPEEQKASDGERDVGNSEKEAPATTGAALTEIENYDTEE